MKTKPDHGLEKKILHLKDEQKKLATTATRG